MDGQEYATIGLVVWLAQMKITKIVIIVSPLGR
jgi:hypothetical protein